MATYIEDKSYNNITGEDLTIGGTEFDNCAFTNCDLSNTNFSLAKFVDCRFVNCNLSMVKLGGTLFRDVEFIGCKMLGLLFYDCNKLGLAVRFDNCTLNHSSFYQTKIKKTVFKNSQLQEVDWMDSDLAGSVFDHCDLLNAKFENTSIENVDFRTATNYSIDLDKNPFKKARFSLKGVAGLLDKYDIKIED